MPNPYLEKIAEDAKKKTEKVNPLHKGAIGYASSVSATVASVPVIHHFGKDLEHQFSKANINKKDIESYVKAKNLRHAKRVEGEGFYASPHSHWGMDQAAKKKGWVPDKRGFKHRATVAASNDGIAMHEYGHAHSYKNGIKSLRTAKHAGYMAGSLASKPLGRLALALGATSDNDKVSKGSIAAAAVAHAPLLAEEARASISPYKHLKKTDPKKAKLFARAAGRAYGTYAASAAATVGGTVLARTLAQKARKDKAEGKM